MIHVRYAIHDDLPFVGQDGYVEDEVLAAKVERREVIVAERDSVPVGYARIEYLWSRVPYLALIRVLPEHRRTGVGRAMLGFLREELGSAGHTVLYSSSQADEPQPQTWHRHMGFTECGRLEGVNDGVDELFFRIELAG